jgi:hypothetical protein
MTRAERRERRQQKVKELEEAMEAHCKELKGKLPVKVQTTLDKYLLANPQEKHLVREAARNLGYNEVLADAPPVQEKDVA